MESSKFLQELKELTTRVEDYFNERTSAKSVKFVKTVGSCSSDDIHKLINESDTGVPLVEAHVPGMLEHTYFYVLDIVDGVISIITDLNTTPCVSKVRIDDLASIDDKIFLLAMVEGKLDK